MADAEPRSQRVAVVTLIATSSSASRQGAAADGTNGWLRGARTLGCTLKPIAHLVDLIALCFSLTRGEQQLAKRAGWRCEAAPRVWNPYSTPRQFLSSYWAWDYTLKIVPFGLVRYDRVIIIDSDAFAVEPQVVRELATWPLEDSNHLLATRDCVASLQRAPDAADEIQGGLIVLRPNASICQRLLNATSMVESRDHGGQGFLSAYFRGWYAGLAHKLPYVEPAPYWHGFCLYRRREGALTVQL